MVDYKQLIKGSLSEQGTDDDKLWLEAANLVWKLNNCSPNENDEKIAILKQLFGEFGEGSVVCTPFSCNLGYNVKIGKNSFINVNCVFLDPETIEIGDVTLLGPGVHIYTANHPVSTKKRIVPKSNSYSLDNIMNTKNLDYIDSEGNFDESLDYTFTNFARPVKIGNHCWIGGGAKILPDVTIGDNVVIGAGSVVTGDIPSNSLAIGSPAKVIKKID